MLAQMKITHWLQLPTLVDVAAGLMEWGAVSAFHKASEENVNEFVQRVT